MAKKKIASKSTKSIIDSVAPTIARVEQELMTGLLTQALALKILKNSSKPASVLLRELIDIEVEVGRFIGSTLTAGAGKGPESNYTGALSGALSFVSSFNGKPRRPSESKKGVQGKKP